MCLECHTSLSPIVIVQTQPRDPAQLQGMLGKAEARVGL